MTFQFTRPRGARPALGCGGVVFCRFNSRAHGGRDAKEAIKSNAEQLFQFTRPRGARLYYLLRSIKAVSSFNSRAHGGRDLRRSLARNCGGSFNSRAHGGRDSQSRPRGPRGGVSIHAPTGGATLCAGRLRRDGGFNSRAHGGRDFRQGRAREPHRVSIHAPTGGATNPSTRSCGRSSFNSRAHGGRDHHPRPGTRSSRTFQFTRPRGARPTSTVKSPETVSFQFTRPRGARQRRTTRASAMTVSIHAPTGGATSLLAGCVYRGAFQFTRPRGARPSTLRARIRPRVSIHAPTGGATLPARRPNHNAKVSIHAPTGGATEARYAARQAGAGFNSRAHGGRDFANQHAA